MKAGVYLCLISLIVLSCKETTTQDKATSTPINEQTELKISIENTIKDYIDLDIFSGTVFVAQNGAPIYQKAFGLADRSNNIKNTVNTLFDIGSMNKTFTSIVIKQLAAEGKLDLENRLVDYLPGFKDPNTNKITITHLLNHQSGFGDYHDSNYFELPKSERTLNAIVDRAKSYRLLFEPGEGDEYSNLGYVILGAIIEKISGKSYFDNVKARIVTPLNLQNTYLNNFDDLKSNIAIGYYYTPLGDLEENSAIQDEPNPDGGFLSTTADIMKFYHSYYYDDELISKEMKAKDPFFQYLKNLPQGKATGAFGGFEGFNTALYQVYSDDLSIIVFANMDEPVAEHIALDILKLTRGETPDKPKLPAVQNIRIQFEKKGAEFITKNFEDLTTNFHPEDPKDLILNALGYAHLYEANQPEKAIAYFKLNTELFPDIANCWDSLGEAYIKIDNKEEAITAYSKALSIQPNLESAKNALEILNQQH